MSKKRFLILISFFAFSTTNAQFYHEKIQESQSDDEIIHGLHIADMKEIPEGSAGVNIAVWNRIPLYQGLGNKSFTIASYDQMSASMVENKLLFEQNSDKDQQAKAFCFDDKGSIFLTGETDIVGDNNGRIFLTKLDIAPSTGPYGLATYVWGRKFFLPGGNNYKPVDIYYNPKTKNIWLLVEEKDKYPVVLVVANDGTLQSTFRLYIDNVESIKPFDICGVPGDRDEIYISCSAKSYTDPTQIPRHDPLIFRLAPSNSTFQAAKLDIPDDNVRWGIAFFESDIVNEKLYYGITYYGGVDFEIDTHFGEIARDLSSWSTFRMFPIRLTDIDFKEKGFVIAAHHDYASLEPYAKIMKLDYNFNFLWQRKYSSLHTGYGPGGKVASCMNEKRNKFIFDYWGPIAINNSYKYLNELWTDDDGTLSSECSEPAQRDLVPEVFQVVQTDPIYEIIQANVSSYEWTYTLTPYFRELTCGFYPQLRPLPQNHTTINQDIENIAVKQTGTMLWFNNAAKQKENLEIQFYTSTGQLLKKYFWTAKESQKKIDLDNSKSKFQFFRIITNKGVILKSGSILLP